MAPTVHRDWFGIGTPGSETDATMSSPTCTPSTSAASSLIATVSERSRASRSPATTTGRPDMVTIDVSSRSASIPIGLGGTAPDAGATDRFVQTDIVASSTPGISRTAATSSSAR